MGEGLRCSTGRYFILRKIPLLSVHCICFLPWYCNLHNFISSFPLPCFFLFKLADDKSSSLIINNHHRSESNHRPSSDITRNFFNDKKSLCKEWYINSYDRWTISCITSWKFLIVSLELVIIDSNSSSRFSAELNFLMRKYILQLARL